MKHRKKAATVFAGDSRMVSLYLWIMLGFFPVYFKYQYSGMGDAKYSIFSKSTVLCVSVLFLSIFVQFLLKLKKNGFAKWKASLKIEASLLDKAVLLYFLCTTVSFLCTSFKEDSFAGAAGWNMGYLAQFLFVAIYFLISRKWNFHQGYIWLLMASSAIVFLAAVLHRFDVDIFNIYGDLELEYKIQFLSTMGQASWYSSFLCTVFPVGLYLFFIAEKKEIRIISGIYSVLAMCTLVTQNTDSAFLSLFFVLLLLFYLSFDGEKERQRFYEVIMLIFGSFTFMGLCQRVFADQMIPLDSLSLFFSQRLLSPCLLLAAAVVYLIGKKKGSFFLLKEKLSFKGKEENRNTSTDRKFFWILISGIGAGILLMILFIVLNSTGFLYTHFGYQNVNNYLLFTDHWGNQRGFAWRYTWEAFSEMPFLRKWIGVGPDAYSFYAESVPEYAAQMEAFWGSLTLTNAHNEYLTKLINVGIFGLLSYLFMLGSAIYIFVKNRKEHVLLPAFALCVVSYMAHNIFGYEQVCCTPFFYILLGFGGNLIHNKIKKSTY